jgi:hypothetical protein
MRPVTRPLPSLREAAAILANKRTRSVGRAPRGAGAALAATVKTLGGGLASGAGGLETRWREVVGDTLAKRSEPVRLVKVRAGPAALEIRVDGPAAALIQHQCEEILARANLFLGAGAVGRLRIVQGPLKRSARQDRPSPPALRAGFRRPLDAANEKALGESLAALPEGPLKEALRRLGREVIRGR